jgi:hypothetical protein
VPQSIADWIDEHDSTERSALDFFDEPAQSIKDFRECTSGGEHLEQVIFSGKQCLGPCRVFDIGMREVIGRGRLQMGFIVTIGFHMFSPEWRQITLRRQAEPHFQTALLYPQ